MPLNPSAENVNPLNDLVGRLRAKLKESSRKNTELATERDEALKKLEDGSKKWDENKLKQTVDELKAELRSTKHKVVINEALKTANVKQEAIEAFYTLSNWKPEGDEPDPTKVQAFIAEHRVKFPFLFTEGSPAPPPVIPTLKPGPASGQGNGAAAAFQTPGDDDPRWSDVKWQWSNFDKIAQAATERRERGEI